MTIQQIKTLEQVSQFLISTANTTITPPSKADISVSHLYNLCASGTYQQQRWHDTKTQAT